jgi:hypothetical protein
VEDITARDIAKGEELTNIFGMWRVSADKTLPYKVLKFIGKEVASARSDFAHPKRGVYDVFVSADQKTKRDEKLRNIFEDVVRKLIPSREIRRNEYEAAEAMRSRGGDLAKHARKRREKSEYKLLARLAVECELCMMGAKSWLAYDEALRGDGVVEAIQASFLPSSGSSSEEEGLSRKTAVAAWMRARAVKVTPPRAKQAQPKSNHHSQSMAATMKAGFASLRMALASDRKSWGRNGNNNTGANQQHASGTEKQDCWQCGKVGHAWWQKDKCKLSGKPAAAGSVHAQRAADKALVVSGT